VVVVVVVVVGWAFGFVVFAVEITSGVVAVVVGIAASAEAVGFLLSLFLDWQRAEVQCWTVDYTFVEWDMVYYTSIEWYMVDWMDKQYLKYCLCF